MLLQDGRTVYDGPVREVKDYFGRCGFAAPPDENPMDYYFDVLQEQCRLPIPRQRLQRVVVMAMGKLLANGFEPPGHPPFWGSQVLGGQPDSIATPPFAASRRFEDI